ncbi:MAG: 40S ribosomal protein S19 [Nanoarchaeota archaeon]|nr:40S ribosomal protein S19 [Nanoarchaeota archaeon]
MISGQEINIKLAEKLKEFEEIKEPDFMAFVKSSVNRERPPIDSDFWYKRAASILRQISIRGVVGISRLRTRYGGKKDRGGKPNEFRKGSGKIIRLILQQAEEAGLVEKIKGKKSGRKLTDKGLKLILEAGNDGD